MNFLPENYQAPKPSGYYMKIQQGENKIRILSRPVFGWEEWTKEMKPVRYKYDNKPKNSINPQQPLKHFWSFIVWNYNEEQIQILHVTQAGIRKGIEALCKDADWGEPFFYDIKIIKEGEEMKTKYMVNPLPHKPTSFQIIDAFNEKPCYLDALFTNEDPFSNQWEKSTPGIFKKEKSEDRELNEISFISSEEVKEFKKIISQCSDEYKKRVDDYLQNQCNGDVSKLQINAFKTLKEKALIQMSQYQYSKLDIENEMSNDNRREVI